MILVSLALVEYPSGKKLGKKLTNAEIGMAGQSFLIDSLLEDTLDSVRA